MTEEEKQAAAEKERLENEKKSLGEKDSSELIDMIRELRGEAKDRRLKAKELEDKLNEFQVQKQKEEQDKKLAEGKKDEVIIDLTKQLEEANKIVKSHKDYENAKRSSIKDLMKDDWLESFNLIPLSDLEKIASKYDKDNHFFSSDNGGGKKKQPGKLEGLRKDLLTAIEKKDTVAQIEIKRMIREEEERNK